MPTYEYECLECKYRFERFQSIKEPPLRKCPTCGGEVRRLIGVGAGIIFKGQGFYHTDYVRRNSDERKKKREESKEKSAVGGSSD
ncbi:MAG: FmdB family zinc ribbon protein [candidate division WOR-3 bacterium]